MTEKRLRELMKPVLDKIRAGADGFSVSDSKSEIPSSTLGPFAK